MPAFENQTEAAEAFEIQWLKFIRLLGLAELCRDYPEIEKAFLNPLDIKVAFSAKIKKWMEKPDAKKRLLSAAKEMAESGGRESQKVMNAFKEAYEGKGSKPTVKKARYGKGTKEVTITHHPGDKLTIVIPHYFDPSDDGLYEVIREAIPSEI